MPARPKSASMAPGHFCGRTNLPAARGACARGKWRWNRLPARPISRSPAAWYTTVGAVFIPGATVDYTLARLQNYDGHKDIFRPDVIDSRLLSHSGNDFHIYLRLVKKKVVTVVLNTEFDVRYTEVDKTRWRSVSRSRKIAEVERAGKPDERELPAGTGQGFLWKLTTYWRFVERDGGTWVECEAVSLTRDVPMGLGWIVEPIIRNLPRESLFNTLFAMRRAIAK